MAARIHSIFLSGVSGIIVNIECYLSNNLPTIVIVGCANRAVGESKERIRGAFASSRIMLPRKRITVNLAPADIPKGDSGFDMAIAVAILQASGEIPAAAERQRAAFIGELGLDGSVQPVRGLIGKLLAARQQGITDFYIPAGNLQQARLVPGVILYPVKTLAELHGHFQGTSRLPTCQTDAGHFTPPSTHNKSALHGSGWSEPSGPEVRLNEIIGQTQAKRALEIAAAGGHNILFGGPPGTGKSMLAKALGGLLPPLNHEEMLEVTQLHSLASQKYDQIVTMRPVRAPHHTASHAAMIGGGSQLRPGEISLAHRGVLFLDELPEFKPVILEALRQPLEDRTINLARINQAADFPANFILVGTANPCPCGYLNSAVKCTCSSYQVKQYAGRLSGPIMDRIDLYCHVGEIQHDKLLATTSNTDSDEAARQAIVKCRLRQHQRFQSDSKLNSDMTNNDIKIHARLEPQAISWLNEACRGIHASARVYMRTIKVARTIADLANSPTITLEHLTEAMQYRYRPTDPQLIASLSQNANNTTGALAS